MPSKHMTTARQPAALYVLGAAEIGDRFAFYALLSVFVLYLTDIRHIDQSSAYLTFYQRALIKTHGPIFGVRST